MGDKPLPRPVATRLTLRFSEITGGDVPLVGGKNASLGEMYRQLRPLGIPVPNGFAVTAEAYRQVLERAGAIVTNRGGRTCHAAIVARELGIPAVVGAENASTTLRNGEVVTVSCAEGIQGRVYDGAVAFSTRDTDITSLAKPRTKVS